MSACARSCTCPGRRAASGTTATETVSQRRPSSTCPRCSTSHSFSYFIFCSHLSSSTSTAGSCSTTPHVGSPPPPQLPLPVPPLPPALPLCSLPPHDPIFPSTEYDEKFIVLIFENGLVEKEKSILGDILSEIGRGNNLSDFPTYLSFDEANLRLVNYNKASKQKEEKVGGASRGSQGTSIAATITHLYTAVHTNAQL